MHVLYELAFKDLLTMWYGNCLCSLLPGCRFYLNAIKAWEQEKDWKDTRMLLPRLMLQQQSYTITAVPIGALGSTTVVTRDWEAALARGHQYTYTGAEYDLNSLIALCTTGNSHLLRCPPGSSVIHTPWSQVPDSSWVAPWWFTRYTRSVPYMRLHSMLGGGIAKLSRINARCAFKP